jgi:CheY-like chemotaxis protein
MTSRWRQEDQGQASPSHARANDGSGPNQTTVGTAWLTEEHNDMSDEQKVLVVDDMESISWAISQALSRGGEHYVKTALSGEEALEIMENESFDLVLTDIRMQGMTGIELLAKVKTQYPDTGVVVMTAYGSQEAKREASQRGSLHYLDKPFEMDELQTVVHDALQRVKADRIASAEEGFSGQISNLSLVDMVQLHCMARNSVTLEVRSTTNQGNIGFIDGEITFAETADGMTGEDAFVGMLGWTGGDFETVERKPDTENIDVSWEALLLEASDVIAAAAAASVEQQTADEAQNAQGEAEPVDMHSLLEDLALEQGVMGVFIIGDKGELIDHVITTFKGDISDVCALPAALKSLRPVHDELEKDTKQNRVIIQFEKARVLSTEIKEIAVFLIVLHSGVGSLGRLVQQLTTASQSLASLF